MEEKKRLNPRLGPTKKETKEEAMAAPYRPNKSSERGSTRNSQKKAIQKTKHYPAQSYSPEKERKGSRIKGVGY